MSTELSVLLWDGEKSLPSEQPSASYNYFGTNAAGELGWWGVSAASSISDGPRYIYNSSLPASSGNQFKTWTEVAGVLSSGQPASEVMLGVSGAQVAGSANFRLGTLSAVNRATGNCSLSLGALATLECLSVIKDGALLVVEPTSAPALTYSMLTTPPVLVIGDGAALRNDSQVGTPAIASQPFIAISVYNSSQLAIYEQWAPLATYDLGKVVANGSRYYLCTTAGTSASSGGPSGTGSGITDGSCVWRENPGTWIRILPGQTVYAVAGGSEFGNFPNGWATGSGTIIYSAGPAFKLPVLPGFSGTIQIIRNADAANVKYEPANQGQWPTVPDDTAEALDLVASRLDLPAGTYLGNDGGGTTAVAPKVLPTKLFVGPCEPSAIAYGAISAPFPDLPDAMAYISGRGEQCVEIHISPGSYSGCDLPPGKSIVMAADGGVTVQHLRFTADGSQQSSFTGRGLIIQSLDTNSPSSGTDIYNVKLDDCVINEGVSNNGNCDLRLVFDRVSIAKETTSTLLTATDTQFGQTINGELKTATRCTLPENLKLAGLRAEFYHCKFPAAPTTISMTNGSGTERCYFDKASAVAFAAIDGDVAGGEPDSQYDGPWLIRTDGTFSDGQCARLRTPILVRPCTGDGLDSSDMIGIVSPAQMTPNRLALVWGHGRVPLSGYPDRPLYRDGSGMLVPFSSISAGRYTQRVGQYNGDAIYLQIGEEITA